MTFDKFLTTLFVITNCIYLQIEAVDTDDKQSNNYVTFGM